MYHDSDNPNEICPCCKHDEIFDEGPLCESCLADVEFGRALRGDYDEQARISTIQAIGRSSCWLDGRDEIIRLCRIAAKWS